ncbi:MAG: POTRA domain-containing protein, partial [Bdellovibrionota bacterium]
MRKIFPILLLLLCPFMGQAATAASEEPSTAAQALRGERVVEIVYSGDTLPENTRARIEALKGKEFSPTAVRALLLWYHENGGESFLGIDAAPVRGGVKMLVKSKQKLRISEVVFEGNASVSSNLLQPVIDLKDGFEFEKEAAEAAVQKLTLYYSKQGYLATEVK